MSRQQSLKLLCGSWLAMSLGALAAPTEYKARVEGMSGAQIVTRDGQRAVIEYQGEARSRSLLDLATGKQYGWDPAQSDPDCSTGTFGGDWGDVFQTSESFLKELAQRKGEDAGAEVLNGFETKIISYASDQGTARAWVDTRTGLLVKLLLPGPDGKATAMLEVKSLELQKPPEEAFALPPKCRRARETGLSQAEYEKLDELAARTGGKFGDYVPADAAAPGGAPAAPEKCAVDFSVVNPKTMSPARVKYTVGVDLSAAAADPSTQYGLGGPDDKPVFSGGGLRNLTPQVKQGVLRLLKPPAVFHLELRFDVGPNAGAGASTSIRSRCFGKAISKLYLVLANADDASSVGKAGTAWVWGTK